MKAERRSDIEIRRRLFQHRWKFSRRFQGDGDQIGGEGLPPASDNVNEEGLGFCRPWPVFFAGGALKYGEDRPAPTLVLPRPVEAGVDQSNIRISCDEVLAHQVRLEGHQPARAVAIDAFEVRQGLSHVDGGGSAKVAVLQKEIFGLGQRRSADEGRLDGAARDGGLARVRVGRAEGCLPVFPLDPQHGVEKACDRGRVRGFALQVQQG